MADPTPIPSNFYFSGGIYQTAPGTNTPSGATPLSAQDFITGAQAHIDKFSSGEYANSAWSQNYVSDLKKAVALAQSAKNPTDMGAGDSGESMVNGVPVNNSDIAKNAANEAAVKAGTMKNIGTSTAPLYIPVGSPADKLQSGGSGALANLVTGNGSTPTPTPGTTYTIKSGDTLDKIAASFGTTADALASLNGLADKNKIQAGATLKLPDFKTILPTSSATAGITSTEGIRTQQQLTDLQAQKDALTKYGLTDTTMLAKAADGSYVPTQQALTQLAQNKIIQTQAGSTLAALTSQGAPQLKDLNGNPVTEQTLLTHLQAANGVTGLQTQLNTVNQQIADAQQAVKQGIYDEEGKLKSMASMSASEKRMSDQASLTLSALTNQAKAINDQLTTANSAVSQMMAAADQDYKNASDAYDKQYSQAVQLQQLLDSESNTTIDNARANLTIMMNTVAGSGSTPNAQSLTTMNKLATQAGWPDGLLAQVLSSNIGTIDYTTTGYDANGNQVVSFFSKAGGGKLIKSVTTPGVKAQPQSTATSTMKEATTDVATKLQAVQGKDQKVAPKDYNAQKQYWQSQYGLSGQSFDAAFSGMVDSSHMQDYNINY